MMNSVEQDIHILRYFSSFISVSNGKVINITDPVLTFCPLAGHLYKGLKDVDRTDKEAVKREIKQVIDSKIKDFGFFTAQRKLLSGEIAILFGASEMLMFALNKNAVDAAVVVCDGAGTIVTNSGELVQGVGARMNSLLLTSPIKNIKKRLEESGCEVVFDNALIDQAKGVDRAIKKGHKKIAVTVRGHDSEKLREIRGLESACDATVVILVVCTTGVTATMVDDIRRYADLVWSCGSSDIRRSIGPVSLLQISKQIPVFVLTQKGVNFFSSYSDDSEFAHNLDKCKQYLISNEALGQRIRLGTRNWFLREENLSVLSKKSFSMVKV